MYADVKVYARDKQCLFGCKDGMIKIAKDRVKISFISEVFKINMLKHDHCTKLTEYHQKGQKEQIIKVKM